MGRRRRRGGKRGEGRVRKRIGSEKGGEEEEGRGGRGRERVRRGESYMNSTSHPPTMGVPSGSCLSILSTPGSDNLSLLAG